MLRCQGKKRCPASRFSETLSKAVIFKRWAQHDTVIQLRDDIHLSCTSWDGGFLSTKHGEFLSRESKLRPRGCEENRNFQQLPKSTFCGRNLDGYLWMVVFSDSPNKEFPNKDLWVAGLNSDTSSHRELRNRKKNLRPILYWLEVLGIPVRGENKTIPMISCSISSCSTP